MLIGDVTLAWQDVVAIAAGEPASLSGAAERRMATSRSVVDSIVRDGVRAYGVNTGLGGLSQVVLSSDRLVAFSLNTLKSHACGVGAPLPAIQVRAIMVAAVQNFAHGRSGISPRIPVALLSLLNAGLTPVVPAGGSVGYLTHMAHIGLALVGLGEIEVAGQVRAAADALTEARLEPLHLFAKDGLSLVNGTPCASGLLSVAMADAVRLARWADVVAAMSFEALRGQSDAFDADALAAKPHPGAQLVGSNLRRLLAGSEHVSRHRGVRTQDALSLRAIPQVHGATRDQLSHVERQLNIELASSTDNPLIFGTPDNYRVLSQANPHGQSLAFAADLLALAAAELGGIAERRIYRLIDPSISGLPPFLLEAAGEHSGLMIAQYAAASLAAENKLLAQPLVVENFVTSALQEDHLSFSTPGALKALKVLENVERILAIEYLTAGQALQFVARDHLAFGTRAALDVLRSKTSLYVEDRIVSTDIEATVALLREPGALARIESEIGAGL
nr:histidine ammonia-lyase [Steroidobacter cummioxidans]